MTRDELSPALGCFPRTYPNLFAVVDNGAREERALEEEMREKLCWSMRATATASRRNERADACNGCARAHTPPSYL